ncbi:MAG: heavy metal-binding domain-containing protein [Burkholderiales bacterium]|nr:heavy metal-binding domain-containing protein [Burkholderiales bacterium]
MAWFSKSSGEFFLSTVLPQGQGGAQVAQFLGLVNGEAIIGANIFRDMFSSVRDVVGGRAGGYERALAGARDAALDEAKAAAKALGADGIVGIDFDYEVLGETNGMMMVAVSGTAVKMA